MRILWSIKYYIEDKSLVNRKRNEMFESREKGISGEGWYRWIENIGERKEKEVQNGSRRL